MKASPPPGAERLLIYTPYGKDAQHLSRVLRGQNIQCEACASVAELVARVSPDVTGILTTEEVFLSKELHLLVRALKEQPSWSAIPVLVFYTPRQGQELFQPRMAEPFEEMADLTFLPRPVSALVLRSAIRGAIRDRHRQYRTRDLLEQLQLDIERRATHEDELRRAHAAAEEARQAAELANQTKTQFLANMSHEIRTPLGAIMGFADLIAAPDTSREERDSYIAVIRRNSNQLLRIIDDILDLSKVESGRMIFESIGFSLLDLLKDFGSMMALRARENGIGLEIHGMEQMPDWIESDPTRLKQILVNVVGNAIKFTRQGRIDVMLRFENGCLVFTIKDTGRGISPEQSRRLFQPFIQADSSITRKYGGTGLGLILTKRLCQAMGGDFYLVESQLERGSTFEARVAVRRADRVPAAQRSPQARAVINSLPLLGRHILLVEDSADNQALIKIVLNRAGADVDVAGDGLEGVAKALDGRYSLVLMDVQMPRMGGIEAVRTLREKGFHVPIVALTAHAMKEESERCLEAGFSHFLSKPVQQEDLVEIVRSLAQPV